MDFGDFHLKFQPPTAKGNPFGDEDGEEEGEDAAGWQVVGEVPAASREQVEVADEIFSRSEDGQIGEPQASSLSPQSTSQLPSRR